MFVRGIQRSCRPIRHFSAKDLSIFKNESPAKKPKNVENLPFASVYTDHMLEIDWTLDGGWEKPRIHPFQNLSIHPGSSSLQYAIQLFEGLKAYRRPDRKVQMFRPNKNMDRMQNTANALSLPHFDQGEMLECISALVDLDRDWIPDSPTASLYIRPTMIGTNPHLGLNTPTHAKIYCIMSPVGPYFNTGRFNPVSLFADPSTVRAFEGGSGSFKMGANYGPTLKATNQATKLGHQQVLWLYGKEHYITEVGTMNIMIFWTNSEGEPELVTPSLDKGVILPGVIRDSLLTLAREWKEFKVTERPITMSELVAAVDNDRVLEVFGTGTACVVCPVSRIAYGDRLLQIPTMRNGAKLATRFLNTLNDIQYGNVDKPEWQVVF